MKHFIGRSYIFFKINPIFSGYIPFVDTRYKYKSQKVLESIADEGSGSNNPGDTYLSHFPDTYYNISIIPIVHPCILVRYFNTCNYI